MQQHTIFSKKFITITILVFVIVLAATVAILQLVNRDSGDTATRGTEQDTVVSAADEIIKKYIEADSITGRSDAYIQQEETPLLANTIIYQPSDNYAIYVAPERSVEYLRSDASAETNDSAVLKATQEFLAKEGMKVISEDDDTLPFVTYDSAQTVCQITTLPKFNQTAASLRLACTSKTIITARYDVVEDRLKMYADTTNEALNNIVTVSSTEVTEEAKQLDLLHVYGDSYAYTLIFAAVDEQWEYLGKRNLPVEDPNVDTTLPADVKAAISDPKYGDFITKYVQ